MPDPMGKWDKMDICWIYNKNLPATMACKYGMIGIHVPWSSHLSWMGIAKTLMISWGNWGNAHPQTWRKMAAIHCKIYKELSPTLTRRLRGMGLTAKGAFALIAFFQKSLRACLRASFWQALVVRLLLEPMVHFLSEADKAEVDDEKNKEFDIASEQQKGTKPLVSVSW